MRYFIYRYGIISTLSFFLSNLLFFIFLIKFNELIASLITLFLVLNINIFFFFKLKIFRINPKNYFKIIIISISSRVFEFLLFNFLHLRIFTDLKSSYLFALTLMISFLIKSIFFYINSDNKR